jgi:hypothetical protein
METFMMYKKIPTVLIALLLSNYAALLSADSTNTMPDRDELESAMKECESSLSNENNSMPDPSAMESCMSAKGFTPPSGGHRNPPPRHRE